MTTTKPQPVFLQGNLEAAAEIHLTVTNDGDFYQTWVKPRIQKLVDGYRGCLRCRAAYHPLIAVHVWTSAVVHACTTYRRCTGSDVFLELGERVALARMLELKYREEVLSDLGIEVPDQPRFECDDDLNRTVNEF